METESTTITPKQNVRKLQKRIAMQNIEETLLKFKYTHLISDTIADQFHLEPVEIKQKLVELKLPLSQRSVAALLHNRAQEFTVEELEGIHSFLQLYQTALYSQGKKWTPINLLEPTDDLQCLTEEILRHNILQALRIKGLNAVVRVITYNALIWIMIVEKKLTRRRGIKLQPPIYVCYEVGTPYIFVPYRIPDRIMECILKAMQYKSYKIHQLEGKNIKSLLAMLKHKAINNEHARQVTYQPADLEIGHRMIDFSKRKARLNYANNLFQTQEPILLDHFTAHADAAWRDNVLVPEMSGEPFPVTMTLKSKNVINMMKYMITNDMVTTPLPEYMMSILLSSKNKIVMRATQA